MDLFESLPQEDVHQLWKYLEMYSDGSNVIAESAMSHFLRYWNASKESFFYMFGKQFILKREVLFEKHTEELEEEMNGVIRYGNAVVQKFIDAFTEKVNEIFEDDHDNRYRLKLFVTDSTMLVRNQYDGPAFIIPGSVTTNGRPLQVNSGCKVVKMVGKIADALNIKVSERMCKHCGSTAVNDDGDCKWCSGKIEDCDGYEEFRRAHSLVLNQKKIKGTLCLSIHPLDFLTMSDNDCGWTSCMSWMEEYGDYRMGTIEMMNSPSVVIAYMEAKEPMMVCGREWSNKKWRQLYVVTPEMILGNRQYPYDNDTLQGTTIKWLRDLCTAAIGWGPYADETCQVRNNATNIFNGSSRVHVNISTCYMYNDIYDNRLAYVKRDWDNHDYFDLNISGAAVCTGCGDEIEYDTIDANRVQCRACDGSWRCDWCGDWHSEYTHAYYVGDNCYCEYCYHNELETCECCHEPGAELTHVYIQIHNTNNESLISNFNYNYYVSLCDCCMNDPDAYEPLFGPMYTTKNMWGTTIRAFDLANVTDAGLEKGELQDDTIEFLKAMRAAEGDEARLALIQEFSY